MRLTVKRVAFNGFVFTLYPVSWLASLSKRKDITIRVMERNKILPTPIFNTKQRQYCADEITAYSQLLRDTNLKKIGETARLKAKLREIRMRITDKLLRDTGRCTFELPFEKEMIQKHKEKR